MILNIDFFKKITVYDFILFALSPFISRILLKVGDRHHGIMAILQKD